MGRADDDPMHPCHHPMNSTTPYMNMSPLDPGHYSADPSHNPGDTGRHPVDTGHGELGASPPPLGASSPHSPGASARDSYRESYEAKC